MDLIERLKILLKSEDIDTDLLNFDVVKSFLIYHRDPGYVIHSAYKSDKLTELYLMCCPSDENPTDLGLVTLVCDERSFIQKQFLYLQP